jgi:hypothetical protein
MVELELLQGQLWFSMVYICSNFPHFVTSTIILRLPLPMASRRSQRVRPTTTPQDRLQLAGEVAAASGTQRKRPTGTLAPSTGPRADALRAQQRKVILIRRGVYSSLLNYLECKAISCSHNPEHYYTVRICSIYRQRPFSGYYQSL